MIWYILILIFVLACPYTRLLLLHPYRFRYIFLDLYKSFENRKVFKDYGIYIYGGIFGAGKSLSVVQYLHQIVSRYDNIEIISNLDLNGLKYKKFEYFEELLTVPDEGVSRIFVIDEVGSLLNSRNYKDNKIGETQFLYMLNQIRKNRTTLLLTSQRFGMTDKTFRQVAVYWIECSRFWRFIRQKYYDAYDVEYSSRPIQELRPIKKKVFFADNKVYALYNTCQLVTDFKEYHPIQVDYNPDVSSTTNVTIKRRGRH